MNQMTTHERFLRMYRHEEADRVPFLDYAWPETVQRWRSKGLPTDDYLGYFNLDKTAVIAPDNSLRLPVSVLEENDEYITYTTVWGATQRSFKKKTTTPEYLDFKINSPDAWRQVRDRMAPSPDRIDWDSLKRDYPIWKREGRWITGELYLGFDVTHSHIVGTETLLIALLEEPEWVNDLFMLETQTSLTMLDMLWDAGYTFDEVHWYDDMGYKNTQFFSLATYRELLKPYHQMAIDWAHRHGCVARLHSCGNIMPFVPELVSMGLDALNPLEVKVGMQPAILKEQFGRQLVFHGGFNAMEMSKRSEIIPTIEHLLPIMKEDGGYIFASDHFIPPSVSFEDMSAIIAAYRKYGAY